LPFGLAQISRSCATVISADDAELIRHTNAAIEISNFRIFLHLPHHRRGKRTDQPETVAAFICAKIPTKVRATQAKQRSVKRFKSVPVAFHKTQIQYSCAMNGRNRAASTAGKLVR